MAKGKAEKLGEREMEEVNFNKIHYMSECNEAVKPQKKM